jgi:hypothetical protein
MGTQVLARASLGRVLTLGNVQTGNGTTTDILDRGKSLAAACVEFVTTVGATPTITVALEVSNDGVNWYAAPYSLPATPTTVTVANPSAITSATTTRFWLTKDFPWRYFRVTRSANTNVTITTNVYVY